MNEQILQIPEERFLVLDLKKHFRIDRQFDLVLSLEVAEHLPPQCAQILVDSLTRLGPVIVFSAAIPYQGGTNHLNEQWPTYWARFFEDKKYIPVDCIRKRIWQNNKVGLWYAQNLIIFVREDDLATYPLLKREFKNMSALQLDVVHPIHYLKLIKKMSNPRNLPLLKVLLALPDILRKAVKSTIKRFFPK